MAGASPTRLTGFEAKMADACDLGRSRDLLCAQVRELRHTAGYPLVYVSVSVTQDVCPTVLLLMTEVSDSRAQMQI